MLGNKYYFYTLVFLVFICSFNIYYFIYNLGLLESFYYALMIFLGDVKAPLEIGYKVYAVEWKMIYICGVFGVLLTSYAIVTTFLKDFILKSHLQITKNNPQFKLN